MGKYCCTKFGIFHQKGSGLGIGIRIIELPPKMMDTGIQGVSPFRVLITYEKGPHDSKVDYMIINYCPFCGIKLTSCYDNIDFVNESAEIFIPPR